MSENDGNLVWNNVKLLRLTISGYDGPLVYGLQAFNPIGENTMATDPKKDQEVKDEKLEDASGGCGADRLPDGSEIPPPSGPIRFEV